MDKDTNVQELKDLIKKFAEDRDWDQFHTPKDLAIGIVGEASEILEHFRFKSEKEIEAMFKDSKKKEEISDELADLLIFLCRFAQRNNIDLSESFKRKLAKADKKYPIEKSRGSNKKYTEF